MAWTYDIKKLGFIVGGHTPDAAIRFSSVSTDTRTLKPGDLFFALDGEHFEGARFIGDAFEKGACAVVASQPTDDGPCIFVYDALKALQAFAAYHRNQYDIPVIAITGSCGKTTCKDMTAALLETKYNVAKTQGNLNNHIGCPLSLLQIDGDTQVAIIELGANHGGEIADLCLMARPTEAAITLVAPSHLEGFGSIENIAKAKAEIVDGLTHDGLFYVNTDDQWCREIADNYTGFTSTFGAEGDIALHECRLEDSGDLYLRIDPVGELRLPLPCQAHASNVLLAIAIGLHHGITEFEEPLRQACQKASRLKITDIGPLEVIDDTYNANPTSVAAALEALAARDTGGARIAALADMLELGDAAVQLHRDVGRQAAQQGVTHLLAKGAYAHDMIDAARQARIPFAEAFDDHQAMAEAIHKIAQQGDVLLLKGSRGMQMECVTEALRTLYDVVEHTGGN